jgi:diguanylate cyclase (GGDEF)-like protein
MEAAGVALIVITSVASVIDLRDGLSAITLLSAGLIHAEGSRSIERVRRHPDPLVHVDLNSVWTFPAAVLLPFPLTAGVVIILYVHLWIRVNRTPPMRRIFSTAMFVVASYFVHLVVMTASSASGLAGGFPTLAGVGVLIAAAATYYALNLGFVLTAAYLRRVMTSVRTVVGRPSDNALEAATLCFGAFVAVAVANQPLLVVFALPLVLVLHRDVLIRQLRDDARTDHKTGLRNASAWNEHAGRQVARAQRQHGTLHVLLIDIDWFKSVNDTYGHLAGDEVLRSLADALRDEIRETDAVGRFGGEEFVIVLPDTSTDDMFGVAERVRARVNAITVPVTSTQNGNSDGSAAETVITGLTVSIGASSFPANGQDLDALVFAADTALYEAKNNGRDQTRLAR